MMKHVVCTYKWDRFRSLWHLFCYGQHKHGESQENRDPQRNLLSRVWWQTKDQDGQG